MMQIWRWIGTSKALSSTMMQEAQSFDTLRLFMAKTNLFYQVGKKTRREQMHLNQALTLLVYIHQLDLCSLMKGDGMVISLA
jgi:hypothetical protein